MGAWIALFLPGMEVHLLSLHPTIAMLRRSTFCSTLSAMLLPLGLAGALSASPALAQGIGASTIRVLTLDTSRTQFCGTLDFNFVSGNAFSTVRGELLDTTNFGLLGLVDREVELLPPVAEFNEQTLAFADMVLIGNLSVGLSECEILDVAEFVNQGGGLFAFNNLAGLDFDAPFGAVGDFNSGSGPVTITDATSPVIQGPFGMVPDTIGSIPFHRTYSQVGTSGNVVLSTSNPVMVEFAHGTGRAVVMADEEWCTDGVVSGCAAGQMPDPIREQLFLNAFASVVPDFGFFYSGERQCIGTQDCSPANVNSRGTSGIIYATGSLLAADNALTLHAERMPPNELGFFLNGTAAGLYSPPQSDGTICLIGAAIGRYNGAGQILSSGNDGKFELDLDLNDTPTPFTPTVILAGETWRFQAWYRDGASNNFTDAIELTFQ